MLDSFNNPIDPDVDYARGRILKSSFEEKKKYANALKIIAKRMETHNEDYFYIFTGNVRNNALETRDLGMMSEEWVGQAVYQEELRRVAIEHASGNLETDDVAIFNRTSAANVATILALGGENKKVISMAPQKKHHPSVSRGAKLSQSTLVSIDNAEELKKLNVTPENAFCLITSVTSELLYFNDEELKDGISASKEKGLTVIVDDAYGARIRPIIFGFTPALLAGADVITTNNDKAGLNGPRAGVMVGKKDLVTRIHSKACELGLEARAPIALAVFRSLSAFDPDELKEELKVGQELFEALREELGEDNVRKSLLGPEITADTILRLVLDRAGLNSQDTLLVPAEAASAVGMELLSRYGVVTTNASGMPGARVSLRLKTNRPTLDKLGGAHEVAKMLLDSLDAVGEYTNDLDIARKILLGE
jgi:L-seryl-tRNA(Ser) seleniumtransferase